MASLGHGISDAVRNHIPVWVDSQVVDLLYEGYKKANGPYPKPTFANNIKKPENWVRKKRVSTSSGWERQYHCKTVQSAQLIVHSPSTDMSANAYVFKVDGEPVAGGKTKLKSVQISTALSKDKTSGRLQDIQFVKFSEEEIIKMRTQMEFGDGFSHLEEERIA